MKPSVASRAAKRPSRTPWSRVSTPTVTPRRRLFGGVVGGSDKRNPLSKSLPQSTHIFLVFFLEWLSCVLDVVSVKPPTAQRRSTTAQQGSGSATPAGRHSTACAEALRPRPTYFHYSAIINLIPSAEIWGYTCLVTNPFTHTPPFSHTIKHSIRPSKTHIPWPEQTTSTHFHCFSVTVWLTTRVRLTPPTTRWRAS